MKLTVIGGGGVRSMFLAKSIAQRAEELHIDELVFMDNDPEKLRIYGGLAAHVARMLCPTMKFTLTSSAEEAVTDADYVITTIRVGGDATRVRDERLALDLGILGQETTGAAGVSFAMRSIPALAEYCELIKKLAKPGVKVFNLPIRRAWFHRRCVIWDMISPTVSATRRAACCTSLPTCTAWMRPAFTASATV